MEAGQILVGDVKDRRVFGPNTLGHDIESRRFDLRDEIETELAPRLIWKSTRTPIGQFAGASGCGTIRRIFGECDTQTVDSQLFLCQTFDAVLTSPL